MTSEGTYIYIVSDKKRTQFCVDTTKAILVESWKCKAGLHPSRNILASQPELIYYEYIQSELLAKKLVSEWSTCKPEDLTSFIKQKNPDLKDVYYDVWVVG
jgi:hypothetical protein